MADFRKFSMGFDSVSSERSRAPDPAGYDPAAARESADGSSGSGARAKLPLSKRQELLFMQAQAPFKQVGMMCFMMWMSGSQLHLFSIITTLSGLYQPFSAILNSGAAFPADPEGKLNTVVPRLTYCCIHGLGLAFAIYRITLMGLLPTKPSDWVSSLRPPAVLEHAAHSLLPAQ